MLGARVEVVFPDGLTLLRRVRTDGSYGSANDPRGAGGVGEPEPGRGRPCLLARRRSSRSGAIFPLTAIPHYWRAVAGQSAGMSDSTKLLNRFRAGALLLIGLGVLPFAAAGESAPVSQPNHTVEPIPHPDLSRLEPAAQKRIRDTRAGLESMAKAGKVSPKELSQAYGEMGKLYHVQDFLGAAEACYLNAEPLAPTDFRWPYYLGHIYKNKGDLEESIAAYQRAMEHQSENVPAILGAAEGHLSLNRYDRAQPLFERALALDKDCAPALVGMGKIASSRRDTGEAIRNFEAALALQPEANSVHYLLAMSYRRQGDLDQAQAHFQQVAMLERLRRGHATAGYPDPLMEALDDLTTGWRHHWVRGMRGFRKGAFCGGRQGISNLDSSGSQEPRSADRSGFGVGPNGGPPRGRRGSTLKRCGSRPAIPCSITTWEPR